MIPESSDRNGGRNGGRIGGNFLTLSLGQLAGRAIGALTTIYLARVLLDAGFGAIAFAGSLLTYGILIVDFGLDMLGSREVARARQPLPALIGAIVSWRLLLSLPAIAALAIFIGLADLSPTTKAVSLIYSLALFTYSLDLSWVLLGAERMRPVVIAETCCLAIVGLGAWLFVAGSADILLVPALFMLGRLVSVVVTLVAVRRLQIRIHPGLHRELVSEYLPAVAPLAGTRVVATTLAHFDLIAVGLLLTEEAAGQYGVAYRIFWVPILFVQAYYLALRPAVSRAYIGGLEPFLSQLGDATRLLVAGAVGVTVGTIVLAEPLVVFLFTDAYLPAVLPLQILMLSFLAHAVMGHYRQLLISFDLQGAMFRIMAAGALVNVAANLLLIPFWGIRGAAVAAVIAAIVILALSYLITWRNIRHIPLGRYFIRPVVAALLMTIVLAMSSSWSLVARILFGGGVYAAALFLLRVMTWAEVQAAIALLRPQKRRAGVVGHSE